MRLQNIILVISSVLSLSQAAPVAEPDSSPILARDIEIEARDLLNREAEPAPYPPSWKREASAEAEAEAYPPSWRRKRDASASPEPRFRQDFWKKKREPLPLPLPEAQPQPEAEAYRPDWKREAEAEAQPEAWRSPSWKKREASPPDW